MLNLVQVLPQVEEMAAHAAAGSVAAPRPSRRKHRRAERATVNLTLDALERQYVAAYRAGDLDTPDRLTELARQLEQTPEGRAFVEQFNRAALEA